MCRPVGGVSYVDRDGDGNLKRDLLLCFDNIFSLFFKRIEMYISIYAND